MEVIAISIGIIIGFIFAYLFLKYQFEKNKGIPKEEVENLYNQISSLSNEKTKSEERAKLLETNLNQTNSDLKIERDKNLELNSELARTNANTNNLNIKLNEQKHELEKVNEKLTNEFKNIANEILEDKSKKFTIQNKDNIDAILNPLQQKIKDFEDKVNKTYNEESRDRATLAEQIRQLTALNQIITKEAENLTTALKGQSKTQGDWGELILEEILEKSGLVKGTHYEVQKTLQDEDGKLQRPDVIVNLPDNKHIVIDSKVSLTAYTEFNKSENPDKQKEFLNEHIESVKRHIKNLSDKNYQNIYQLKSLDFVLMFIPIEPAFILAVKNDASLFNVAFEKNVVIVTTSTLLVTLLTIGSIWKQENQSRNAVEIARKSGELYDKFVGFLGDLNNIGSKIQASQTAYDDAIKKLSSGKGNIIRRTEELKTMGAKATKSRASKGSKD